MSYHAKRGFDNLETVILEVVLKSDFALKDEMLPTSILLAGDGEERSGGQSFDFRQRKSSKIDP